MLPGEGSVPDDGSVPADGSGPADGEARGACGGGGGSTEPVMLTGLD